MTNLAILGQTSLCGVSVPNIYGGFGDDRKAMLAKAVAELHGVELKAVNQNINRNRGRFIDGVHVLDLKNSVTLSDPLLTAGIMSKQSIANSENIYLLSERGYVRLLKIMDDDTAWEKWDIIEAEYFGLKESKANTTLEIDVDLTPRPDIDTMLLIDYLENNFAIAERLAEMTGLDITTARFDALTKTEELTGRDLGIFKKRLLKMDMSKTDSRYLTGTVMQAAPKAEPVNILEIPEKKAYSLAETMKLLGLGRNTVSNLLIDKKLKGIKVGSRWLIPAGAINEFLEVKIKSPN